MQIEIGKVYKCGEKFVYIDYMSEKLDSFALFPFIGFICRYDGKATGLTSVGRFSSEGVWADTNPKDLSWRLQETSERETITVRGSKFYLDEFEAATKNLERVEE